MIPTDPGYRVLAAGDWPPGSVSIAFEPNGRRIVPEVEAAIESSWAAATADGKRLLFDGPMCRLQSWSAGGGLSLRLAESGYKAFFGTNISDPTLADRFGPDVMANPLGVSPAVETSDGHLLMGRRNASVAYYPGRVHPFAGCLEPTDVDVFSAVTRELMEELSVRPDEVAAVRCTGLIAELALRQTELIFAARVTPTRAELIDRLDPGEHASTWSIVADPAAVAAAIRSPDPLLTPIAVASLELWARFGRT